MLKTLYFITACVFSASLSAQGVNTLNEPDGRMLSNTCAGCHGTYGASVGTAPPLTGIPVPLFVKAMQDFKSGARSASVMDRIARGYDDDDFHKMAEFFAEQ